MLYVYFDDFKVFEPKWMDLDSWENGELVSWSVGCKEKEVR